MSEVKVERVGGIGGFGLPGGRLKSRGAVRLAELSETDRAKVDQLFEKGDTPRDDTNPHGFRYRLTRDGQTVEVSEAEAPEALTGAVRDEFE